MHISSRILGLLLFWTRLLVCLLKMSPNLVAVAPLVAIALVTLLVGRYYFSPAPSRPTRSVVLLVLGDMG